MSILDAIIQGIIQGATEFLPVSSSGHLSISQHMFGIELPGILFDIMLHLGTLIAVIFVYRGLVWRLIKEFFALCGDIVHRQFKWSEMNQDRRLLMMLFIGLLPLFLLFLPIPGTGMKVKDFSEQLASDKGIVIEGLALLATSTLLFLGIVANKRMRQEKAVVNREGKKVAAKGRRKIHTIDALLIGLTQCLAAIFPGLSRSGCTISAGMLRGFDRAFAVRFSFLMSLPAVLGATLLKVVKVAGAGEIDMNLLPMYLTGMAVAGVVGYFSISLVKLLASKGKFGMFAYYCCMAGTVSLAARFLLPILFPAA